MRRMSQQQMRQLSLKSELKRIRDAGKAAATAAGDKNKQKKTEYFLFVTTLERMTTGLPFLLVLVDSATQLE